MKSNYKYLISASALSACVILTYNHNANSTDLPNDTQNEVSTRSSVRLAHDHSLCGTPRSTFVAKQIAKDGLLWEKAEDDRVNHRVSLPLDAKALANFSSWKKGAKVRLAVSKKFPAMEGQVTHTGVQADGTIITHVVIAGDPVGHLTLQENKAMDFFHGQITYENYPVAYQIDRYGKGMNITRTSIEGILCSLADHDRLTVNVGLPPLAGAVSNAPGGGKGGKPDKGGGGNGGGGSGGGGGGKGKVPSVSISSASLQEGDSGSASMQFAVTLNKSSTSSVTVDYATSNSSATAGSDYNSTSGTVTFAAGETAKSISVAILGDTLEEGDESFNVSLSNPVNAKSGSMSATGTIIDDDVAVVQPSVSIGAASLPEGDSGSVIMEFSVTLDKSADGTVTVDYGTADGSATAGADYNSASGTLTFAAGETSQIIGVTVTGDTVNEGNETFTVSLSNPVGAELGTVSADGTIVDDDAPQSNVPVHNSRPGATAVIYLDMDGEFVTNTPWNTNFNDGNPIDASGVDTIYSSSKMSAIWARTAEDFTPFNVNVTTDEAVYLAAPSDRRIRCIITPDNEWYGGAGGVAYVNSFTWTGDTPCWTFSDMLGNSAKNIAEASSHEAGHTLGLRHDGRVSPSEGYYYGHGSGATGWAPIMGVGYNKSLVQWSKGEYLSASNSEDDLAIITSRNGFGYRSDDHGNNNGSATTLSNGSATGVIETSSDVDFFALSTNGGSGSISVTGDSLSSNLDVLLELYDSQGSIVATSNPTDQLSATISTTLDAGTYYLKVSGIGKGDPLGTGYTDYGSLGKYTVTTTLP